MKYTAKNFNLWFTYLKGRTGFRFLILCYSDRFVSLFQIVASFHDIFSSSREEPTTQKMNGIDCAGY